MGYIIWFIVLVFPNLEDFSSENYVMNVTTFECI